VKNKEELWRNWGLKARSGCGGRLLMTNILIKVDAVVLV
jgi:hypothetical protein